MKKWTILLLCGAFLFLWISRTETGDRILSKARAVDKKLGLTEAVFMPNGDPQPVKLEAKYAILIDAESGRTLYAHNERKRAYPASTTKIMTALLALELGKLDELVTVGPEAAPEDPQESRAGLRIGQQLKLYDLIEAALLPSGNDAARTIAVHIARKHSGNPKLDEAEAQQYFASLMNKRAKEAGAAQTHFVNSHGLHDPNHYSTARDLVLIARTAMANETFRQAVQASSYMAVSMDAYGETVLRLPLANTNQLLKPGGAHYFEGATGVKTGFTDQAGYCLVSSATRDGRTVIAVVLHSTIHGVYEDAKKLLELGLGQQ